MTTEEKKKLRTVLEKVFRDTKMWSPQIGVDQNIFKLSLKFNGISFGTYRMILRRGGENPVVALTYADSSVSSTLYKEKYPTTNEVYSAAIESMYRIGIEHAFKSISSKITTVASKAAPELPAPEFIQKEQKSSIPISLTTVIKDGKPIVPKMDSQYLMGYLKTLFGSESNWIKSQPLSDELDTYKIELIYDGKRMGKYLTFIDYDNRRVEIEFRDTRNWSFNVSSIKLPMNSGVDRMIAIQNVRLEAAKHAFELITNS